MSQFRSGDARTSDINCPTDAAAAVEKELRCLRSLKNLPSKKRRDTRRIIQIGAGVLR
jgi:hypothetical protein